MPAYFLENVSKSWSREETPRQRPLVFWLEEVGLEFWGRQNGKSSQNRVSERTELQEQELQRSVDGSLWTFSWLLITTCMWGSDPMLRKELSDRIIGNIAWSSYRVNSSVSFQQPRVEKLIIQGVSFRSLSRILP